MTPPWLSAVSPTRLTGFFCKLGPTFIKIGQYLALRPDLLPQEYCDELLNLVDRVEPVPWSDAMTIIQADLKRDPRELFAWINPNPVSAASLAQVYHVKTHDGIELALKVQRPGIRDQVKRDLKRLRRLVPFLWMAGIRPPFSMVEVISEITRWMEMELDPRQELANITRMHKECDQQLYVIPRPYPEYCGSRVLAATFLNGMPYSDLLRLIRNGQRDKVLKLGFDPNILAERLMSAVLIQIFRIQFFHADTHPGNLIALPGNQVGFVDFGLTDMLDSGIRKKQMSYFSALYVGDMDRILNGLMDILEKDETSDLQGFQRKFQSLTIAWMREKDRPPEDRAAHEVSPLAGYMIGVMQAARQSGLRVPVQVLSMYRALLTAETVASQLGAGADLRSTAVKFFSSYQAEAIQQAFQPQQIMRLFYDLLELVEKSPGQLGKLLSDLTGNGLALKVTVTKSRTDQKLTRQIARLLTSGLLAISLTILLAIAPQIVLPGGYHLTIVLWGVLLLLYAWIFIMVLRL